MRNLSFAYALAVSLSSSLAGCGGDDPIAFSDDVGIELKAESDKVVSGTVSDEKSITTESGNPYGAFVSAAENALGRDPARIEVESVTILLGAGSTGVTSLGEIFDGTVDVLIEMNDTGDTFPIASGTIDETTTGGGPVPLTATFDSTTMSPDNYTKLLGGSFDLVYRAPAQPDFSGKTAKASLQVTLRFAAFEE